MLLLTNWRHKYFLLLFYVSFDSQLLQIDKIKKINKLNIMEKKKKKKDVCAKFHCLKLLGGENLYFPCKNLWIATCKFPMLAYVHYTSKICRLIWGKQI